MSNEDQVLCVPVGIFGNEETKQREARTLEMRSRGFSFHLLLNSVNDLVTFSEAETCITLSRKASSAWNLIHTDLNFSSLQIEKKKQILVTYMPCPFP